VCMYVSVYATPRIRFRRGAECKVYGVVGKVQGLGVRVYCVR